MQNSGQHGQTLFAHASKICAICEICGFNVFIRSELVKSDFPRAYYDKYL
jgi:hypothetical protein